MKIFDQSLKDIAVSAFTSLGANKIRTFLTMLGIIIGVFAVITLVSLVKGVQNYITDQFNSLGSNLVFVMPGRGGINQDPALAFTDNKLEQKHVDLILSRNKEAINFISPFSTAGMTAKYKAKKYFAVVAGAEEDFEQLFNIEIDKGRFFTRAESVSSQKVAVLGYSVNKKLFGDKPSIGESVKLDDKSFIVVGTMKTKSPDFDDEVIIPFSTGKKDLKLNNISYISAKLKPDQNLDEVMKQIESTLLTDLKKDDFTVMNQADLLASIQSILGVISAGLGGIAAISLIVGGIGIMNIMLVAVNERVREIGLRKALGATSFGIALQFLLESAILSFSGGIIGAILGLLATLVTRQFVRAEVPFWALALALGFSLAVGLIFGTYPAYKASKKSPIEALRYE